MNNKWDTAHKEVTAVYNVNLSNLAYRAEMLASYSLRKKVRDSCYAVMETVRKGCYVSTFR